MAIAMAGAAACPAGTRRPAPASSCTRAKGWALAPRLAPALWTALPPLLLPLPLTAPQGLAVAATITLFLLIDLAIVCREHGRTWATLVLLLAAGGLGAWLGTGPAVLAFLALMLLLCAGSVHPGFAALAAMCRVDAGSLAAGEPCGWLLLLAAACLAAVAAGPGGAGPRSTGADVRVPTHRRQIAETARMAVLAAGVGAGLALLGSENRVGLLGPVGAFLPAPFLLLGMLRCGHLALAVDVPGSRHLLHDRVIAAAVAGAAAALAAGTRLPGLA